ncbi:MAG: hypothetical protein IKR67_01465, partial [Lachnospiraceae bacterium]|nr:hypothetical protein [Lachnospiraceae bacterium]
MKKGLRRFVSILLLSLVVLAQIPFEGLTVIAAEEEIFSEDVVIENPVSDDAEQPGDTVLPEIPEAGETIELPGGKDLEDETIASEDDTGEETGEETDGETLASEDETTPPEGEVTPEDEETTSEETEPEEKEPEEKEPTRGDGNTCTVTFYNRDAQEYAVVTVADGTAIGDQLPATIAREDYDALWAIGSIVPDGDQGYKIVVTQPRQEVTAETTVTSDMTVVPDYDPVTYTITFYEEDKETVVDTKTVTASTSYCLNDIPTVPAKPGNTAKWVYSGGEFSNNVKVNRVEGTDATRSLSVWAEYEKNVFAVNFIVEGETYQTGIYFMGDSLKLPADPVVEGKEFEGWYVGETQIVGGEIVT